MLNMRTHPKYDNFNRFGDLEHNRNNFLPLKVSNFVTYNTCATGMNVGTCVDKLLQQSENLLLLSCGQLFMNLNI